MYLILLIIFIFTLTLFLFLFLLFNNILNWLMKLCSFLNFLHYFIWLLFFNFRLWLWFFWLWIIIPPKIWIITIHFLFINIFNLKGILLIIIYFTWEILIILPEILILLILKRSIPVHNLFNSLSSTLSELHLLNCRFSNSIVLTTLLLCGLFPPSWGTLAFISHIKLNIIKW